MYCPDQIPPNLTLTQTLTLTQVGIHLGGIDQGGIFRTPMTAYAKAVARTCSVKKMFLKIS